MSSSEEESSKGLDRQDGDGIVRVAAGQAVEVGVGEDSGLRTGGDCQDEAWVILAGYEVSSQVVGGEVNSLIDPLGLNVELMEGLACNPGNVNLANIGGNTTIGVLDLSIEFSQVECLRHGEGLARLDLGNLLVANMVLNVDVGDDLGVANIVEGGVCNYLFSVVSNVHVHSIRGVLELSKVGSIPGVEAAKGHAVLGPPHKWPVVAAAVRDALHLVSVASFEQLGFHSLKARLDVREEGSVGDCCQD